MMDKAKISCLNCAALNNFPLGIEGKKVVCGRCRSNLPIPGEVLEPTEEQLLTLVQKSSLPVLVDFYSPTCMPCRMMNPIVESLARRRRGEMMVIKVNTDEIPQLAASYGIMGVPTFIVFRKGVERGRTSGALSETDFSLWVAKLA
jgi:thioredoxin 2